VPCGPADPLVGFSMAAADRFFTHGRDDGVPCDQGVRPISVNLSDRIPGSIAMVVSLNGAPSSASNYPTVARSQRPCRS
jgi:hypothetical protein